MVVIKCNCTSSTNKSNHPIQNPLLFVTERRTRDNILLHLIILNKFCWRVNPRETPCYVGLLPPPVISPWRVTLCPPVQCYKNFPFSPLHFVFQCYHGSQTTVHNKQAYSSLYKRDTSVTCTMKRIRRDSRNISWNDSLFSILVKIEQPCTTKIINRCVQASWVANV
jgi:hypothetical protein